MSVELPNNDLCFDVTCFNPICTRVYVDRGGTKSAMMACAKQNSLSSLKTQRRDGWRRKVDGDGSEEVGYVFNL
jgi:hypothetical protein